MITLMKMPIRHGSAPLRVARGHFATNHSHINYFVDITYQKTRLSEAKDSARQLVTNFVNDTPVDTILCLDGTSVVGTCLAQEASQWVPPGTMRKARFTRLVISRWLVENRASALAAWLNISPAP